MQSAVDYVGLGGHLEQPGFQRFISMRAEVLEAQGVHRTCEADEVITSEVRLYSRATACPQK